VEILNQGFPLSKLIPGYLNPNEAKLKQATGLQTGEPSTISSLHDAEQG
jgi:hypothetical protein